MASANDGTVFWKGQDGNVWQKGPSGTQNIGSWVSDTEDGYTASSGGLNVYGSGLTRISDPMIQQNTGGGSSTYDAAAAQRAAARQGIMDERQGYRNSVGDSINNFGGKYGRGINNYLEDMRAGQSNVDAMGAKNELAKMQGVAGVQGMVGRGIKSTGVMLGNRNAGDSSAAAALAGAYGELGQRQMANVGNQYEMGNMDVESQQRTFDVGKRRGMEELQIGKQDFVTGLVNETQSIMANLNARLVDASLPDRIAIEQEKAAVQNQANAALQQYDQQLSSGAGGIQGSSREQRMTMANDLRSKGTDLGEGAFDFTQQAPTNFQGSAPSGGNLPLFTMPRRRR